MKRLIVKKAAVLGAGTMGAQIAAHLASANVEVLLFDLPAPEGDKSGVVKKALGALKKQEPAPLANPDNLQLIEAVNYEEHLSRLGECDLVIEAIAERMDWKKDLYAKVVPHLAGHALIASNTSGLSINELAKILPTEVQRRFCGIHFFNPPRYMHLVELISTHYGDPDLLDHLETWLTSRLGKGVIRALDTPNFVANRIGVFSILAVIHHTARLGLGFDEVDALTGARVGRPKSATYRTADMVGLDVMAHVVKTMHETLPDDPWHSYFVPAPWLTALIGKGALGQKTKAGIFKKVGKEILVLDLAKQDYRPAGAQVDPEVDALLKLKNPAEKFIALRNSAHPQAQLLWSSYRDLFHYCAVQLEHMADNARDIDLAMRWGFGWSLGPFETWQVAGWVSIAQAIAEDIAAGRAMSSAPLPNWVFEREGVHTPQGSWSASTKTLRPRSTLPVYQRQLFPETVLGEAKADRGTTVWENEGVRLWTHAADSGIGILSFKSKMHTVGEEVLDGLLVAIALAEQQLEGMVLWHEAPFAVGANLQQVSQACAMGAFDLLEATVEKFQRASQALKYAQIPTVAAVQGMALGGGCEFVMHVSRRVLALESYIGLVEAGVGLIPAGGGCKEFAIAAARQAARTETPGEVFHFLQPPFMSIAMAKVSKSAFEAVRAGFAKPTDTILFNHHELLYVALKETRALAEAGYVPRLKARQVTVAGRNGMANFEMMLINMREGGMISAHDYCVAKSAATALCGGDVDAGSKVDEEWLLTVERREFMQLLKTPETQARIQHMLETGKPLRN